MYGLRRKKKVFHFRQTTLKNFEQCRNKKKVELTFPTKSSCKLKEKKKPDEYILHFGKEISTLADALTKKN